MTEKPGELNKVEVWLAEHAVPVFTVLALLILIGAGAVFWTYQNTGDVEHQVDVLKPKIAHIVKCNKGSLVDDKRATECAARIRIGLINCRRSQACRAALIAAITYPAQAALPEGGDPLSPSTAGQQPSPGQPGHPGNTQHPGESGGGGPGDNGGEEPPVPGTQAPSPAPSAPAAPEPTEPPETPVSGDQGTSPPPSTSGAGVQLCVLEGTCVHVELNPKGLLP